MGTKVKFYNFVTDGTEIPTRVAHRLGSLSPARQVIPAFLHVFVKKEKKNYRKFEEIEKLGSAWPVTG